MIDSLHTEQHELAEKARRDRRQEERLHRTLIYIFLAFMFVGLVALGVLTYVGFENRGDQLTAINDDLKTVCRVTPEKDAQAEDTCAKAERGELPGPQGLPGDQGPPGSVGPKGDTGTPGRDGNDGQSGQPGPRGEMGPSGVQGAQGEAGETGPKGDPGEAGPAGPQGDTGPAGPKGDTGATGEQGETGPGVSSVDIAEDSGGCSLVVTYTNGKIQSVSIPAAFCLPI